MKDGGNQGARDGFQTWQVAQEYIPGRLIDEFRCYFRTFDPKGSGVIKTEHVSSILDSLGRQVSPNQIKLLLDYLIGQQAAQYNTDFVDFKEYLSIVSVLVTECILEDEMRMVFRRFDLDGDGFISPEELGELLHRMGDDITEKELSEMIKAADLDGDGKISYEEFVCIMTDSDGKTTTEIECEWEPASDNEFSDCVESSDVDALADDYKSDISIVIEAVDTCQSNDDISPKNRLQRNRSLSDGGACGLELPLASNRRKKSLGDIFHGLSLGKSEKQVGDRRQSVSGCPAAGYLQLPANKKRRCSTSGLMQLFKKMRTRLLVPCNGSYSSYD